MKKFLVYIGFLSLISFEARALKLYILSNNNVGDHNQALGIAAAFAKLSDQNVSIEDLNTKALSAFEIKDKIKRDLASEKVVVLGVGEGGIGGLAEVSKHPNLTICLTSHMFLGQYKDKDLLEKVDFIALPTHVSAEEKEILGSKLIETTGVAHNRRADMETYDEWKKELPPADIYLGVYLGGDAPTPTNEIKIFTEEDALRLADYVIAKAKEINERGMTACILVLNGPRTGKFDAEKEEIATVHREGKSDHITELFEKKLADKGIEYKVFDFQYNTPENKEWVSSYNAFDLVAGAVRTTKGKMIVPGESTSVVSEAIDILPFESIDTMPPGKVLVYHNSAMNDVHHAHVKSELEAGRVSVLENYQDIKVPDSDDVEPKPSAAKVVAQELVEASAGEPEIEEAPAEEELAVEIPAEEVAAEETPATAAPAEEAPATTVPSTTVPAIEVPTAEVPAREMPSTEVAPTAVAPIEVAPTKTTPIEVAPGTETVPAAPSTTKAAPKAVKPPTEVAPSASSPNPKETPKVEMVE